MNIQGYALIAVLAAAVTTGAIPAFAANELACPGCVEGGYDKLEAYKKLFPIVIWTDKEVYDHQSTIVVSGHVRNPTTDVDVTIKVVGPTGNVVKVEQLTVDNNGDFEAAFNTASPLWSRSGIYTITAQYGGDSRTDRVQIEVLGEMSTTCDSNELEAKVGNKGYCIPYTVSGATVGGGILNIGTKSLIVKIMAESQGEITLEIPRSVLDSKSGGRDDSFFVLVDEEETDYDEKVTSTTRSVTIQFLAGAEKIEIIGTQIVPEFGPIAALVLAVAIISIIAVSAKTRLRLMPKF
jgi:predicted secreted protein with PEFG-CTERM motif